MWIALLDIDLAHGHSVLSHGLRRRFYQSWGARMPNRHPMLVGQRAVI
jgi:hypothetical protein